MNGFIKKIEQINFGLMSPDDIRSMSTVTVEYPDTFEDDGFPIEKGLMDPRMGVIDSSLVCRTCGFRGGDCQGHFGSIELARPVIHVGFAETIYKLLRSTCNECGRILLGNEKIEYYINRITELMDNRESLNDILDEIYELTNQGVKDFPMDDGTFESRSYCPHCGAHQKPIYFDKPLTIRQGYYRLTPVEVRERLEKITDEDAFVLGVNPEVARPEWMVLTVLPVPPVNLRPPIYLSDSERLENDLTLKLREILRINQRLLENMESGAPNFIIEDLWDLLQYHVTTYFNNRTEGVPISKNRIKQPLNTLIQQINDSFEYRLLNKPMNHVASSIVSPDPDISINEVGIPRNIAKEITVPVYVNEWNIDEMVYYIKNGPNNFPGANYVIRNDGRKIRIRTEETIELILEQLEAGFIVERHLNNSDIVLVDNPNNKFKNFMMAHEVRVLPYDTIRLNPLVCHAYDINFDGSSVDIHILQKDETKAEAKSLLRIQENVITPSIGGPIVGGFNDYILGTFLLTRTGVEFSQEEVFQVMKKLNLKMPKFNSNQIIYKFDLNHGEESFIFKNRGENLTGKELFSLLLPNDLNLLYESSFSKFMPISEDEDAFVVIEDGILKQGVIDKQSFGLVIGKILNAIAKNYESDKVRLFIDGLSKLSLYSASKLGITTSLNDYDIPKSVEIKIDNIINEKLYDFDNNNDYEATLKDISESIFEILQEHYKTQYLLNKLNFNSLMVNTESNLTTDEINSISAFVGQQYFNHEKSYTKRILPHFKKDDLNENRGFIKSSYLKGLNPTEYFLNAINHRENQINEDIAISQSSELMKYLSNALQDLQVKPSGLVTDNQGNVIQTIYGEDNVNPARSDFGRVVDMDRLLDDIRVKKDKENLNSDTSEYDIYRNTFKNLKNILNDLKNMSKYILALEVESIGLTDLNEAINSIIPLITNVLESEDEHALLENYENYNESYNIFKSIYDEELEKIQDDLAELQNKKELDKLKNKIKNILNDFRNLESKIANVNHDTGAFNKIKYEVESQIRLLNLMLTSDNIEELYEVIDDSNEVYINLNSKFEDIVYNIKLNDLKSELEEYLPKVQELNKDLINSNISDMKKNKFSFDIDSLILSINDAQNFDNVDKLSLSLRNIKNSYNSLKSKINPFIGEKTSEDSGDEFKASTNVLENDYENNQFNDELKDAKNNKNESAELIKELKIQLKDYIPKFVELDDKISSVKVSSAELKAIHKDIESNIEVLKSSSRLRKLEKIQNLLIDTKKNYDDLNKRANIELSNIKIIENKINDLKAELKNYLSLFEELNVKASSVNENTAKLTDIKKNIQENIKRLKNISRLKRIDTLENRLTYAKNAYYKLNNELGIELKNIDKNRPIKELKIQIKVYIPKFVELDDKISSVKVTNAELKAIHKDIESNIEVLKSSSRLRKLEKLEKILNDSEKNYDNLNKKVDGELRKIENNEIADDLKLELKNYMSLFEELDEKTNSINENTPKLKNIKKEIKSNIKLLKSSSNLKRIDKLNERLTVVEKSFEDLNRDIENELNNLENNNKIKLKYEFNKYLSKYNALNEEINSLYIVDASLKSLSKQIDKNIREIKYSLDLDELNSIKYSSNVKYLKSIEDNLNSIKNNYKNIEKDLANFKSSYYPITVKISHTDRKRHYPKNNKALKNKIKELLSDYQSLKNYIILKHRVNSSNSSPTEINNYTRTIVLNINLLNKSLRFKKTEKITNSLDVATKNYITIYYKVNGKIPPEGNTNINDNVPKKSKKISNSKNKSKQKNKIPNSLKKDKIKKLINENSNRIIKLRKKYYNHPSKIRELSEISFLNNNLNSKFKNGKYVNLEEDVLDVKNKLDVFEQDLKNISVSNKSTVSKSKVNVNKSTVLNKSNMPRTNVKSNKSTVLNKPKVPRSNVNLNKSKDKSIEKPKKTLSQNDILINNIKTLKANSNNQLDKCTTLKNKLNKIMDENKNYSQNNLINDFNNNFDSYFKAVEKLNDDVVEFEYLMFNHPYGITNKKVTYKQLNDKLNEYSKKFAEFDEKIRIFGENNHVLKNKLKCNDLLNEIDTINKLFKTNNLNYMKKELKEYSNELSILKTYFSRLENNIFSYNLKTISNGKYGQYISIRINEIDKGLNKICKKNSIVLPKELLEHLYSLTGSYGIKSSFWTKFSAEGLSDTDVKNIRTEIANEINLFKLKTYDDVESRINELIKENKSYLVEYLESIACEAKFNISVDECKEIKSRINAEINSNNIRNTEQIESRFNDLAKKKEDTRKELFTHLYDITGKFEIKDSFISHLNKNDLSVKEGKEIRDKVKNEIEKGNIKTSDEIQLKIDNLIKQKQMEKNNELLDYLYSIMGQYGVKFSFRNNFSVEDLSESDINEIRITLKNEIRALDLKSEKEVDSRIIKLIDQKRNEKFGELLEELYKNVGKYSLSEEFLTRLSDNKLNEVNGNYIKQVIEDRIKNGSLTDKSKVNSEIYNLIREERKRQNRAIQKLNEFFINNNAHLIGLSSEDKKEIKNIVEKSIIKNRLSDLEVYEEFKNTINKFKDTKKVDNSKVKEEDEKPNDKEKSSGGLLSRFKRLFTK